MLPFKLNEEQKDLMLEMLDSDGFKLLCEKIIPVLIKQKQDRAFSLHIASEADLLILAVAKSKVDGAQDLANDIASLKKLVRHNTQLKK